MNITVAGIGYVGLSNSVLLSQTNDVVAFDISSEKVEDINQRKSPIKDVDIENFFENKKLRLKATTDKLKAFQNAEIVIVATPTNYDSSQNNFNTQSVEEVIDDVLNLNTEAIIVIKSTIPVGFTEKMKSKYQTENIIFSPEFLREGRALHDNLYPTRVIIGDTSEKGKMIGSLFLHSALKKDVPILYIDSTEAEAVKLFANTYLAMRVSFFNELDSYAELHSLDSKQIIEAVSLDPRIGNHYNNPSFGYGGYCLPKDTKQLLANFENVPNNIISAVVEANLTRKNHIAKMIIQKQPKVVGVYRLTMKTGSDNFRESAIQNVTDYIIECGIKVIIFEPVIKEQEYNGMEVYKDFDDFALIADVIIANRVTEELKKYKYKLYSRDLFNRD